METIFIALFFILLAAEWTASEITGRKVYSLHNSVINALLGGIASFSELTCTLIIFPMLTQIYHHCRLFIFDSHSAAALVLLFFLVDFLEYWYHRLSHRVNLLWSAHIVHHQSEHYNITVGLRASFLIPVFNNMWYAVFPLLGFDPQQVLLILFVSGMYNLAIHTRFLKRWGFLEYILVTPSSHRVHHARNEPYLDKNFGKFFSFWDIFFGTYAKESKSEKTIFGATSPGSGDSLCASLFLPVRRLLTAFLSEKSRAKKWKILFGSPAEAEQIYRARRRLIPLRETGETASRQ